MLYPSIRSHLTPYIIVKRRKTTINHAFAAAIAPSDEYSDERVRDAITVLGQDPDHPLRCAYCNAPAKTWDHVFGTVKDSHFSGYGHRLGNLLPCCKSCNSAKGNKHWFRYLEGLNGPDQAERSARIQAYLSKYSTVDALPKESPEYAQFLKIKKEILDLMAEADRLAKIIREMPA
ncbi:HNH endonuclease [Kerstersia gyiorum]|uniref:HNH endonuclease n=1 Tax=Kerstersia gyiorum TaxID=206506 RepID=UPI00107113C4|nr:HNH endonuclease [Kerstersia gyiorum]QBR39531.1 HNH endonuclease [Kerstersia gyiorum]